MNGNNINLEIGFFGLLQVIFIILKVLNLINWSWPMVFLPLWIFIGLTFLIFYIIIVIFYTYHIVNIFLEKIKKKNNF